MKIIIALACVLLSAGACILADVSARREIEFGPRDSVAEYSGICSALAWLAVCISVATLVVI